MLYLLDVSLKLELDLGEGEKAEYDVGDGESVMTVLPCFCERSGE